MSSLFTEKLGFGVSPTLHGNQRVIEKRARGEKIYHMGFGESPFPVPKRLQESLRQETHHKQYINTAGLQELRDTIATYYGSRHNLDMTAYDVMITPGSKLLLFALQLAYEGDLLLPVPSWVSYEPQARLLRQKAIKVPTTLDDVGYHIDAAQLEEAIQDARHNGLNPAKIILNSPNNPTGLQIPDEELKQIADVCTRENIIIIADDIYGQVCFEQNIPTIAHYAPQHTVVSSAISKHLSLGGWRLGFGLIPKSQAGLFDALCQIASETWSAVAAPIQYAIIPAFEGHDDIETFITDCSALHSHMNRYIAHRLRAYGIICPVPQGAFYSYPDFEPFREKLASKNITTSEGLFTELLDHYKIASLPGIAFGEAPERLTLRLSGCDYDGARALTAYQNGEQLNDTFIQKHAPNVQQGCDAFEEFITSL